VLSNTMFGAYGLFYPAFIALAVIPQSAVYTPSELASLGVARRLRAWILPRSLRLGVVPGVLAALCVPAVLLVPSAHASVASRAGFAVTAALVVLVSPAQDHVRRMLHQSGRSWAAAATSLIQVLAVATALGAGLGLHVPGAWVPFGALAVANILSGAFGVTRARPGHTPPVALHLGDLLRSSGGWMVAASVLSTSGSFINMALLTGLVNATAVAHGEAARILAQPVTVLAVGLLAVLNPELMEGTRNRDVRGLVRTYGLFLALIAVAIAAWTTLIGFDWSFNPLPRFQPKAYAVRGLLPLTIITESAGYCVLPLLTMVYAAGRIKDAMFASLASVLVGASVTALTAPAYGPFALVWCGVGTVVTAYLAYLAILAREFRRPAPAQAGAATAPARPVDQAGRARPAAAPVRRVPPSPSPSSVRGGAPRAVGGLRRPAEFDLGR
jgi:O-antigen/teichoic acid export membrane protein